MEDPMAEDPRKLMTMSDDDLMFYTLSGEQGSYVHEIGQTAMNMRVSLRSLEVTREMARANELLSNETSNLATYTRQLAVSTWAVAIITLITQVALVVMAVRK